MKDWHHPPLRFLVWPTQWLDAPLTEIKNQRKDRFGLGAGSALSVRHVEIGRL